MHNTVSPPISQSPSRSTSVLDLASNDNLLPVSTTIEALKAVSASSTKPTPSRPKRYSPSGHQIFHDILTFIHQNYFYFHFAYICFMSVLGGFIIYYAETTASKTPFIDALHLSTSLIGVCGLSTVDFSRFHNGTLFFVTLQTFLGGLWITSLPLLVIKIIKAAKKRNYLYATLRHQLKQHHNTNDKFLSKTDISPFDIELYALLILLFFILFVSFTILIAFTIITAVILTYAYTPEQLEKRSPWLTSLFMTLAGYNNTGMAPFSDNAFRFVSDVGLNFIMSITCILGNTLYPWVLRRVIVLARRLSPKKHKILFDYILLNHHHITPHLFGAVQTKLYFYVTVGLQLLTVSLSYVMEFDNESLAQYSPMHRLMIMAFHSISSRASGFATVDISTFGVITLLLYILQMRVKSQMLCSLDESAYNLVKLESKIKPSEWVNKVTTPKTGPSVSPDSKETKNNEEVRDILAEDDYYHMIESNSIVKIEYNGVHKDITPDQLFELNDTQYYKQKRDFADAEAPYIVSINEDHLVDAQEEATGVGSRLRNYGWYLMENLVVMWNRIVVNARYYLVRNNAWLLLIVCLIFIAENRHYRAEPQNYTLLKVVFEVATAFGSCGLSLGYPGVPYAFSWALTPVSKFLIIIVLIVARHRGFLGSVKDQQYLFITQEQLYFATVNNGKIRN